MNILGPEKNSKIPDEEANTITAYHEGGHAIVAYYTKDSHPLHKVTIMPRGSSLGHVCINFDLNYQYINLLNYLYYILSFVLCIIWFNFIDCIYSCKRRIPYHKI